MFLQRIYLHQAREITCKDEGLFIELQVIFSRTRLCTFVQAIPPVEVLWIAIFFSVILLMGFWGLPLKSKVALIVLEPPLIVIFSKVISEQLRPTKRLFIKCSEPLIIEPFLIVVPETLSAMAIAM